MLGQGIMMTQPVTGDNAAPNGLRRATLVLGSPTAGISAVAGLIGAASTAAAELGARILSGFGTTWQEPALPWVPRNDPADSDALLRAAAEEGFLDQARAVIAASTAEELVIADPASALFPELWRAALTEAGYRVRQILVIRNPLEVARALDARHKLNQHRALRLWAKFVTAGLRSIADDPAARVVLFDSLFDARASRDSAQPGPATVDPARRTIKIAVATYENAPLIPNLVRRLHAATETWETTPIDRRPAQAREFRDAFADYSSFAGTVLPVRLPAEQVERLPRVTPIRAGASRKLLLHYHLFKNAGTSVDEILRQNFRARWMNTEFTQKPAREHMHDITEVLRTHPSLYGLSSHTMMLPPPALPDTDILPIIFIRHPLDRMRSAYEFEREQDADTAGARLAKRVDFAGYLRARLSQPTDRACRNFQTARFAMFLPQDQGDELSRARETVESLGFVGLVEAFQASIMLLQDKARALFPDFRAFAVWRNATSARMTVLDGRLAAMRETLGASLYDQVIEANRGDLALYDLVRHRYAAL
jgi:hypothetical protein